MTTTTSIPSEAPPSSALRRRRIIGLLSGVVLGILMFLVLPSDLNTSARFVAGVAVLMAIWWMTEALPLAVTALIPMIAFPFIQVPDTGEAVGMQAAVAPYANPIIWLFMGGFVIGLAMQRWNLHRRFALSIVSRAGTNPVMLIGGFMLATGIITMWVSNTATTVMMFPVGMAVLALVGGDEERRDKNFATALLLGIAYAASIGSVATLIGTPPNALLKGFVADNYDITIGFAQWMIVGVPIAAVFLVIAWLVITKIAYRPGIREVAGGKELIRGQLSELGRMSRPEWTVAAVFAAAALSWIVFGILGQTEGFVSANPWIENLDDAMIAIAAAIALFLIPVKSDGTRVLDWAAMRELPWGILLLFGGGLALSAQFSGTGLSAWIGEQVTGLEGVPTWIVVLVVAVSVLLLTELTSNTATTATFLPVMAGVATGLGIEPLMLLIPTALAATMAFMLPVATPPNAIVFGSGQITIGQMVRGGAMLNVVGIVVIMAAMYSVVMWVFI